MGGYRPSIPAYNQTQMMAQRTRAIEHINQLTRLQSRGHRQKRCGTSGRPPSLLDLLWQVAKYELATNPFWQQEMTPEDIPGMVRDWARKTWDARDFDPTNPRDWVDPLGLYRVPKMVTNWWDRMSSSQQMRLMQLVLSVGISMLPVVGDIYDAASAIVGRDLITGEELARWEQALALAPFVGVAVWKLAAVLADSGRIAGKALDVARAAGRLDELGDVARAAGHLDEAGDIARAAGRLDELGDVARAAGRVDKAGAIARTAGRMDVADELAQVGRYVDLPSAGQFDDTADAVRRLDANGPRLLPSGVDHRYEPRYLDFDPEYGHRWSDGGERYGRLSPSQVEELKRLSEKYDRNIVIVGGWAETETGVSNRVRAFEKYGDAQVDALEYGVPWWRQTGPPTSGLNIPGKKPDFDYWTRHGGRDLPEGLKREMAPLFDIDPEDAGKYMDNYNIYDHPPTVPPPSALVFHARKGTVTRKQAPWQKIHP